MKRSLPAKTNRAVEFAVEKGASSWLNVFPMNNMDFTLNKREFRDAVKLRYDWPIPECPSICVWGANFSVDHAMVCKRVGFVIQRHNEIRDLEAELLEMVCSDVQIEPSLQPVTGETLNKGANKENGARLDVHARGLWERQRSAFFDVRVCHPNEDSYREMTQQQIYKQPRNRKEEAISIMCNGDRAWDIYATCIYHNRRNGRRMSQISMLIGRAYIDQERRALRSNNIVDKN